MSSTLRVFLQQGTEGGIAVETGDAAPDDFPPTIQQCADLAVAD
jgi:hypothetical protein